MNAKVLMSAVVVSLFSSHLCAESFDEYLAQIAKSNLVVEHSKVEATAAGLRGRSADLMFTPHLFANGSYGSDEKKSSMPGMTYDRLNTQNFSLGVTQDFSFGLNAKAYYAYDRMTYENAPMLESNNDIHDARPVVELSLPLWQNAFGRSSRAQKDMITYQAEAEAHAARALGVATLAQAEAAYWRLVVARDTVKTQEKALKQSQDIHSYVTKRASMNLGEDADKLQANALVEARRFELSVAQNEERAATRAYNTLRNVALDTTVAALDPIPYKTLESLKVPKDRPNDRDDLKAARAQIAVAQANAKLTSEKLKPTLELFSTIAANGRSDDGMGDAFGDAHKSGRSTTIVGLRFSMPLHQGAVNDAQAGARMSQKVAELNLQQKQIEQEYEWTELSERLKEASQSLKLAKAIETAQQAKLESERSRLRSGRTSTFQVLQFEQDYAQSELNRIRAAAEILALKTKLRLYGT